MVGTWKPVGSMRRDRLRRRESRTVNMAMSLSESRARPKARTNGSRLCGPVPVLPGPAASAPGPSSAHLTWNVTVPGHADQS